MSFRSKKDLFTLADEDEYAGDISSGNGGDPFGDSEAALNSPMPEKRGYGEMSGRKDGRYGQKIREHLHRVIDHLHDRNVPTHMLPFAGGFYWVCDRRETDYKGRTFSVDMLGFMDIQGVALGGRWVAINVTSQGAMGDHVRDYIDPNNTYSSSKKKVIDLLRRYLNAGGRFFIAGYYRPKGRKNGAWHYQYMEVTHEVLDLFESRRRGPRQQGRSKPKNAPRGGTK